MPVNLLNKSNWISRNLTHHNIKIIHTVHSSVHRRECVVKCNGMVGEPRVFWGSVTTTTKICRSINLFCANGKNRDGNTGMETHMYACYCLINCWTASMLYVVSTIVFIGAWNIFISLNWHFSNAAYTFYLFMLCWR